jgi:hypothetical protein
MKIVNKNGEVVGHFRQITSRDGYKAIAEAEITDRDAVLQITSDIEQWNNQPDRRDRSGEFDVAPDMTAWDDPKVGMAKADQPKTLRERMKE